MYYKKAKTLHLTGVHVVVVFVCEHGAHGWEETEADQSHRQSWKEQLSDLRERGKDWGRQAGEEEEEEEEGKRGQLGQVKDSYMKNYNNQSPIELQ